MIKQKSTSKQSSPWQSMYELKARLRLSVDRPLSTTIENGYIVGSYVDEYGIFEAMDGTRSLPCIPHELHDNPHLGEILARRAYTGWKELPHRALVNLPTYDEQGKPITRPGPGLRIDPKSVERFVRTYGVLRGARIDGRAFTQDIAEVAERQDVLRQRWLQANRVVEFDSSMMEDMEWEVQRTDPPVFRATIFQASAFVLLTTEDLWKFICYLFLWDCWNRKIGVCENPDCPAPYFVKSRVDQKFCEVGPCTQYAHRQAARKWWDENGQRWRAKKRIKSLRKKRK
jgi:hypothetical protein